MRSPKPIYSIKEGCLFVLFVMLRSPKPNYSIKEGCLFVLFVMLRSPKPTFQLRKVVCLFCLSCWDLQSILLKKEVCLFCLSYSEISQTTTPLAMLSVLFGNPLWVQVRSFCHVLTYGGEGYWILNNFHIENSMK